MKVAGFVRAGSRPEPGARCYAWLGCLCSVVASWSLRTQDGPRKSRVRTSMMAWQLSSHEKTFFLPSARMAAQAVRKVTAASEWPRRAGDGPTMNGAATAQLELTHSAKVAADVLGQACVVPVGVSVDRDGCHGHGASSRAAARRSNRGSVCARVRAARAGMGKAGAGRSPRLLLHVGHAAQAGIV